MALEIEQFDEVEDQPTRKIPTPEEVFGTRKVPTPSEVFGEKKNSLLGSSVTPLPSQDKFKLGQEVATIGYKNPLGKAIEKDKKVEGNWFAGWYNTLVGSLSSLAGGEAYISQIVGTPTIPMPLNVRVAMAQDARRKTVEFFEQARSSASSKEYEQQRGEFDIMPKDGGGIFSGIDLEDVKGIAFQVPKLLLDMAGGAATGGFSFFSQSINDNAKELEEKGGGDKMTDLQKVGYLFTQATAQAALEKYSIDKILKNTGLTKKVQQKLTAEVVEEFTRKGIKAAAKEVEDALVLKASKLATRIKTTGLAAAKSALIEGVTEGTQQATSDAVKVITNKIAKNDVFDEEDINKNFWKNIVNSAVMGGVMGGAVGGGLQMLNNTNKAIRKDIASGDLQGVQQKISQQVEEGNLTPEEAEAANITAQQYAEIAGKIPTTVSEQDKYKIIGGIEQRENLKRDKDALMAEMGQLDPIFRAEKQDQLDLIQAKIDETDDYLEGIVTGKTPRYIKREGRKGEETTYYKVDEKGNKMPISKIRYELAKEIKKEDSRKKEPFDENRRRRVEQFDILYGVKSNNPEFDFPNTFEEFNKKIDSDPNYLPDLYKRAQKYKETGEITEDEMGTEKSFIEAIEPVVEKDITIGEVVDKKGTYKGQKGTFLQEGDNIVFKNEMSGEKYQVGKAAEIQESPASEFDIKYDESLVAIDDKGNISVREKPYINRYSNPLKAINKDEDGNVVSVNLETEDGKKRTFKGSIAEDIAYQINLKEKGKEAPKVEPKAEQVVEKPVQVVKPVKPVVEVKEEIKKEVKPTEVEEIPSDLEEKGELIESTLEAERRRSNGERIFAITEQDEAPVEVTSIEMLRNYTPDQLLAYKPKIAEAKATEVKAEVEVKEAPKFEKIKSKLDAFKEKYAPKQKEKKQPKIEDNGKPIIVKDPAENDIAIAKLSSKDESIEEPSIKAIEGKAESTIKAKLDEVVLEVDDKIKLATRVEMVPMSDLKTDEGSFQNREGLNLKKVDDIVENYNPSEFDPIIYWTNADGQKYTLNHHRFAAAQKLKLDEIPATKLTYPAGHPKEFQVVPATDKAEAIDFAINRSNANRSMETAVERAKALRKLQKTGTKEEINKFLEREGKNKTKVQNIAALNENGKTIEALKMFGDAEDVQLQKETEQRGDWIGEARRRITGLTDEHENEMFDFLMDKDASKRITSKADFISKVTSLAGGFDFNPENPLNLKRFKYVTEGERAYDEKTSQLKSEIDTRQSKIDELKARFSDPSRKDYIPTDSKDYEQTKKIADEQVSKLNTEIKSFQQKLQDHYKEKGKYQGGIEQGGLFATAEATTEEIDDMADIVKYFYDDGVVKLEDIKREITKALGYNTKAIRDAIEKAHTKMVMEYTPAEATKGVIGRVGNMLKNFFGKEGEVKVLKDNQSMLASAEQIAETGGRVSFQATLPNGEKVTAKPVDASIVNGFYSPLELQINQMKQDKMPAKQWLDKLRGEEAKWTGLADWLSQQEGSLTKENIKNWLQDNQIEINEIIKGEPNIEDQSLWKFESRGDGQWTFNFERGGYFKIDASEGDGFARLYVQNPGSAYVNEIASFEYYDRGSILDMALEKSYFDDYLEPLSAMSSTQYSKYTLHGNKSDYKEILITLPAKLKNNLQDKLDQFDDEEQEEINKERDRYVSELGLNPSKKQLYFFALNDDNDVIYLAKDADDLDKWKDSHLYAMSVQQEAPAGLKILLQFNKYFNVTNDALEKIRTKIKNLENDIAKSEKEIKPKYKSSHFDEKNILVHVRSDIRTDSKGNKIFFIEEVQSDWGQEGKKQGFSEATLKEIERYNDLKSVIPILEDAYRDIHRVTNYAYKYDVSTSAEEFYKLSIEERKNKINETHEKYQSRTNSYIDFIQKSIDDRNKKISNNTDEVLLLEKKEYQLSKFLESVKNNKDFNQANKELDDLDKKIRSIERESVKLEEENITDEKMISKLNIDKSIDNFEYEYAIRNSEITFDKNEYAKITKEYQDLTDKIEKSKITKAPFVTKTNDWAKLGLKVALKNAVQAGATKIAWTNGEQQNERYDLSKQVNYIERIPENDINKEQGDFYLDINLPNGLIGLNVNKESGIITRSTGSIYRGDVIGKPLSDVIGKDMADKIMQGGSKKYEGDGLKIGGKGMKGFYGSPKENSLGILGDLARSLYKQTPEKIILDNYREEKLKSLQAELDENTANKTSDFRMRDFHLNEAANETDSEEKEYNLKQADYYDKRGKNSAELEESVLREIKRLVVEYQYSINITPELKQQVQQGLPLFMAKPSGDILGFTYGKKIYLNGEKLNPNTPIHEAGHIWTKWVKNNNIKIYEKGMELVKGSKYLERAKSSKFYQEQASKLPKSEREAYFQEEALAMAIGDKGAQFVSESKKNTFKEWLDALWTKIKSLTGFKDLTADEFQNLTFEQFTKMAVKEVLGTEGSVDKLKSIRSLRNKKEFVKSKIKGEENKKVIDDFSEDELIELAQNDFDTQTFKNIKDAVQKRSTEENVQREQRKDGETRSRRGRMEQRVEGVEIAEEGETAQPKSAEKKQVDWEGAITIAANAERRNVLGLIDYESEAQSFEDWKFEAEKLLKRGYDVEALLDRLEKENQYPTPVENAIRKIYVASLDRLLQKDPSNQDVQQKLARYARLNDLINTRLGRTFVSLKGSADPRETLSDFFVAKMKANSVDKLTEKQEKEVLQQYKDIQDQKDKVNDKFEKNEELNTELIARDVVVKEKKARKPYQKTRDYKAERKSVIESIKEKWNKAGKSDIVTAVPVPYSAQLVAIAPDVSKLMRLYIEEGVDDLAVITSKIYNDLRDEIDGLQPKDIQDVIAGRYKKERPVLSEAQLKQRELKKEAELIAKIEDVLAGVPKTEKAKIEQNQKLAQLRNKLRDIKKEVGYDDLSKLDALKTRIANQIEDLDNKIKNNEFEKEVTPVSFMENPEFRKKYPKQYDEYLNDVSKLRDKSHEFEVALAKDHSAKMNIGQKIFKKFVPKLANTLKALLSTVDDSFIFVQLLPAIAANPALGYRAFKNQWKDFFNEARFKRQIVSIEEDKELSYMVKKSGLDILDPQQLRDQIRDEQVGGANFLEEQIKIGKLKIVPSKYINAPFERLASSAGNYIRLNMFIRKAAELESEGKTIDNSLEEYKNIARVINEMTGRGKLHKNVEKASGIINPLVWSPKMLASTLNLLGIGDLGNFILGGNKGFYRSLDPKSQAWARENMVKAIGMMVLVMAAFALDDEHEVDYDPNSVTFGQIKNTKTGDAWGVGSRFTSVIRYVLMMGMGVKHIKDEVAPVDYKKESFKFFRGKASPATGLATDAILRTKFNGEPFDLRDLPYEALVPLAPRDIYDALKTDGTIGLLTKGIPAFMGIKVMTEKMYNEAKQPLEDILRKHVRTEAKTFKIELKNPLTKEIATDKEYDEYVKKRDELITEKITKAYNNGVPVKDKPELVPFVLLNEKEASDEISRLKEKATNEAKEYVFGKKKKTLKERLSDRRLRILRKRNS